MSVRRVIVVRGISGSGKSFLANKILKEFKEDNPDKISAIYSTDDYFIHDGEYKFNGRQLTQAHDWNRNRFQRAIDNKYDLVIVDNTNTQFWEITNYAEYALNHNYVVEVVEPQTEWAFDVDRLVDKNTHGVPREAIQRMKDRWGSLISLADTFREKYKVKVDVKIVCGKVTGLEFSNGV